MSRGPKRWPGQQKRSMRCHDTSAAHDASAATSSIGSPTPAMPWPRCGARLYSPQAIAPGRGGCIVRKRDGPDSLAQTRHILRSAHALRQVASATAGNGKGPTPGQAAPPLGAQSISGPPAVAAADEPRSHDAQTSQPPGQRIEASPL